MERKEGEEMERKKKLKKIKYNFFKKDFKLIKKFYILLQTYLTCFNFPIQ